MLIRIAVVGNEIKLLPAEECEVQPEIEQHNMDNIIEHTAMHEVYTDPEKGQLAQEYEQYDGTEDIIVSEVALLLKTLVDNIGIAGYKIVLKD